MNKLPKYLYAASSSKRGQFITFSDKDWSEFCESQGGTYRNIHFDDSGTYHMLVFCDLSDKELRSIIEDGEHRHKTMALSRVELSNIAPDTNIDDFGC